MLSPERIKEAEINVSTYLRDGLLKKDYQYHEDVFRAYIEKSDESLDVAGFLSDKEMSSLWITVTSYYSMYYIANAILYKMGYRVSGAISHKVTCDALILFVRDKLKNSLIEEYEHAQDEVLQLTNPDKADDIILTLDYERKKRSKFQYEMGIEIKNSRAKTSLNRAKVFILEMNKMLIN
jgi:uncharacterized protein (UPF0332 family)